MGPITFVVGGGGGGHRAKSAIFLHNLYYLIALPLGHAYTQ